MLRHRRASICPTISRHHLIDADSSLRSVASTRLANLRASDLCASLLSWFREVLFYRCCALLGFLLFLILPHKRHEQFTKDGCSKIDWNCVTKYADRIFEVTFLQILQINLVTIWEALGSCKLSQRQRAVQERMDDLEDFSSVILFCRKTLSQKVLGTYPSTFRTWVDSCQANIEDLFHIQTPVPTWIELVPSGNLVV